MSKLSVDYEEVSLPRNLELLQKSTGWAMLKSKPWSSTENTQCHTSGITLIARQLCSSSRRGQYPVRFFILNSD